MDEKDKIITQLKAELAAFEERHNNCKNNLANSRQNEQLLQKIIDQNPVAIQIFNKDGFNMEVNQAHFDLYKETPPDTFNLFTDTQFEEQGLVKEFLRMKKGESVRIKYSTFNTRYVKEGFRDQLHYIRSIGFPLIDSNGQPERFVLMQVDITKEKEDEIKLNELNQELLQLKENIKNSIEQGKKMLSQELHDIVLQDMAALNLIIEEAETRSSESEIKSLLQSTATQVRTLIDKTREITSYLRTEMVEKHGLVIAIKEFAEHFATKHHLKLKCDVDKEIKIPLDDSVQLYRILQEALNNISQHAQASLISISLKKTNAGYNFTIEDNGSGFDSNQTIEKLSFGLIIMKDRAESIGGTFNMKTKKTKGTKIIVHLPLKE
ncbi:MAG: ATP-binding protein [Bacteroidota bacterium]